MKRAEALLFRFLEFLIVLLLIGMVGMVFTNVVLRYAFNTGLLISEELSRFFFVWLTFIGAVIVSREHGHLGVDMLVSKFSLNGRRIAMIITDLLILFTTWVLFDGTLRQHGINATTTSPVSGMNMGVVYGIVYFSAVGIGLITLARLYRALTGKLSAAELDRFAGRVDEDVTHTAKGHLE
ncbi:TRAP transporter small permease [Deinococcus peraridilitoris]|uniref:TRAP-type C4-dicarboxylate transport system, small permease component n=1 Tax=Deinococcus peraridilitoris (strain DSM 19664 / LMG 22246 / CIP 109416 / KR-200) TaxID=937777 RepID=L0A7Q9_DEIPD|nr:TRAP transporter small permease [Deinococcus peraridilitoris]AFZ69479.1 TRAP-type C4-dicarboxylate transport system, small permease component [Deinococcus peraridilitoris DSM 19664]